MRGQGRVFRPKWRDAKTGAMRRADVWWLDYSLRGKRFRESARTTSKRDAQRLLRKRMGDREDGKLVGHPDRVTLADLRALVERQYVLDGRRSLARAKRSLDHLARIIGIET